MANGRSVTIRSSVESLERTPDQLAALRRAYAAMQQLGPTDNRSWLFWAGIHGFPGWNCQHYSRIVSWSDRPINIFLPWHRAYVLYFENVVRDQESSASIPWWDWTSPTSHSIGVPRSFAEPWIGDEFNALYNGPTPAMPATQGMPAEPARQTVRYPGDPRALPTTEDVEGILNLDSFVDFQLQMEDLHNYIHTWTGGSSESYPWFGDMSAVPRAAFDPIFWSHHCMIDRLWYLWQLRHGVGNIPPDYLDQPLAPFGLQVGDVLAIRRLGYEYGQSVSTSVAGPTS